MENDIYQRLNKSRFRSSFHLTLKDLDYIKLKGMKKIEEHARTFVVERLKDISKVNDGKQTPFKGHPVFIAQHATATCCRGCIEKWYRIDRRKILSDEEINYITQIIMGWIEKQTRI